MKWRWHAVSPEIDLTLTLASDDPELIERVEASAKANGITLERIEPEEPARLQAPLPAEYAESAE
jgi:hypothetical protein